MAKTETPGAARAAAGEGGGNGRTGGARRRCPICGEPTAERYRPFCSRRCADIDLGRWLKEGYRVPTPEAPPSGDGSSESDE